VEAVFLLLLSRAFDMAKQVASDKEIPGVLKKLAGNQTQRKSRFQQPY